MGDQIAQGSWVGGLLPVALFFFFLPFPMNAIFVFVEVGDLSFLMFSLLLILSSLFLALTGFDSEVAEYSVEQNPKFNLFF